jgi:hypothetical protein
MLTRVSTVESYRRWLNWRPLFDGDEEPTLEEFVRSITRDEPSEAMKAGTAFHAAIETAQIGEHSIFTSQGFGFELPDAEIELPEIREMRASKRYGDLIVTGKVDCLDGKVVIDHKTTSRADLDRYMDGYQWRFYLDIFGADAFIWHIFEIKETEPKEYRVSAPQVLRAYRYPELEADCADMAARFLHFARSVNLPDARLDE